MFKIYLQYSYLLLKEKARSSQTELKDTGKSLYGQFLLQLEDLQQQVRVLEIDFEHTLSQKMNQFDLNVELMEILRTLPEVSQLKEVTDKEAASFADIPQSTCRQIQITLSQDRILVEPKKY